MKILIISRYPPFPGGRENFVFELSNELAKNNKVMILTPDQDASKNNNLYIKKFPYNENILEGIIKAFNPDIINSHTFYLSEDALKIAKKLNIPFGITLHGDQFAIGNKQRQKIVSEISKNSDFVINVSENGKKSIIKNVNNIQKDKIFVIKNWVNIAKFKKNKDKIINTNNKKIILTPTRIASYKGLDFLIDTIEKYKKNFEELNLLFLISIPDYPFSKEEDELFNILKNKIKLKKIDDLINFIFLKYSNIQQAYDVADIFLLPSEKEQLPISILEAISERLPIISTNVGGIPELLSKNNSMLVNYGDINGLFKSIKKIINRDNTYFVEENYKMIEKEYSIKLTAKKYKKIYNKFIKW